MNVFLEAHRRSRSLLNPVGLRVVLALGAGAACAVSSTQASAEVVWNGNFETSNLSQWDYELNPDGLSVVKAPDPVAGGTYALRIELTEELVWSNGIFRSELQHKPDTESVREGDETFLGWSLYLPQPLPEGEYQFGYFETDNTYNQVFSLRGQGADLSLYLNHEASGSPWKGPGLIEVGKWHRAVFHVKWSADNTQGFVSLWWDGVKVVDEFHARTYVDDEPALVQLGLLKNPPAPPSPVVLYLDEAMEGQSYADVSLGIAERAASPPADPAASTPVTPSVSPTDTSSATDDVTPSGNTAAPAAPSAPASPATTQDDGGGCHMAAKRCGAVGWTFALGLLAWLIRRGRAAKSAQA